MIGSFIFRWRRMILSLLLTAALSAAAAFPAVWFLRPWLRERQIVVQLTSEDTLVRQTALQWIAQHAGDNIRLRRAVMDRLRTITDAQAFLAIGNALDHAGVWNRQLVPMEVWLKRMEILLGQGDAPVRARIMQETVSLTDMLGNPRLAAMLERGIQDADADVRSNAMFAAAELRAWAGEPEVYARIVRQAARDVEPDIAAHAWIMLGLLRPESGLTGDWRQVPVPVAYAMLWASAATNPDQIEPMRTALTQSGVPAEVRDFAGYVLGTMKSPAARSWAQTFLAELEKRVAPGDELLRARLTLGLHGKPASFATPTLAQLGLYESLPVGEREIPLERTTPEMIRLAALAVMKSPAPEELYPLLGSINSAMRDLACVVAAERFTPEQNAQLVDRALRDYDDDAKMGGAILAGLTGTGRELLAQVAANEDSLPVKEILRLGLWMQGQAVAREGRTIPMLAYAEGLLRRPDVPRTTVLLALLQQKQPAGYDYLLAPHTTQTKLDLAELLDRQRWGRVLWRYLPGDAPRVNVWADAEIVAFEIDVLRDWYVLHRPTLLQPSANNRPR